MHNMIKEELEKLGFHTFKHANDKFNELKDQFIEMAQLKSNFDIEKFTVKKTGSFIAHNFHFLMRQYSLALSELRKKLIEKEDIERRINEYKNKGKEKIIVYTNDGKVQKYADLYIKELINRIDLIDIEIANKSMMIKGFEICRLKLIEINDNNIPTNEDYQKEEPDYLKWALNNVALQQLRERKTGITEGTWNSISMLEEPALITDKFEVKMLDDDGNFNVAEAIKDIELRKHLIYKHDEIVKKIENQKE